MPVRFTGEGGFHEEENSEEALDLEKRWMEFQERLKDESKIDREVIRKTLRKGVWFLCVIISLRSICVVGIGVFCISILGGILSLPMTADTGNPGPTYFFLCLCGAGIAVTLLAFLLQCLVCFLFEMEKEKVELQIFPQKYGEMFREEYPKLARWAGEDLYQR